MAITNATEFVQRTGRLRSTELQEGCSRIHMAGQEMADQSQLVQQANSGRMVWAMSRAEPRIIAGDAHLQLTCDVTLHATAERGRRIAVQPDWTCPEWLTVASPGRERVATTGRTVRTW